MGLLRRMSRAVGEGLWLPEFAWLAWPEIAAGLQPPAEDSAEPSTRAASDQTDLLALAWTELSGVRRRFRQD